ncbi:efflux RND transporter periplasmic adaptor subunit [Thiorhodovibrio winogradskyi]|uniref:efflux RND transporter periplasmic adaptor subunit n=1 Tax=Thiorhodovibrio winogradskyi TaxID=77007 RepID=UPI002E29497C|nr:efflux RND transporter periplasmic adaptor subunit [Thiorhodovibrio winogradskyi]
MDSRFATRLAPILGLVLAPAISLIALAADQPLETRAQLSSQQGVVLSAEMAGRVNHIPLKDGDTFEQGQRLLEFDCSLQDAQLAKAQAQLRAAENTLQGQQRLVKLNAVGLVDLRNSEAEVQQAKADVTYLQVLMERCQINAPYNGRVIRYAVREHQSVKANQELIEIIDDSILSLDFIVPSPWLTWLTPGYRFEVHIEDTNKTYPMKLLRTAARVDPISQTVRALAEVDGNFPELLPGMSGTVILQSPEHTQADTSTAPRARD